MKCRPHTRQRRTADVKSTNQTRLILSRNPTAVLYHNKPKLTAIKPPTHEERGPWGGGRESYYTVGVPEYGGGGAAGSDSLTRGSRFIQRAEQLDCSVFAR